MATAVMSWAEEDEPGSQMSVSSGGKTLVTGKEALQGGIGAAATGFITGPYAEKSDGARRAALHFAGSRSPPRPRMTAGPWSNVSQNAAFVSPHAADAALPSSGQRSAAAP